MNKGTEIQEKVWSSLQFQMALSQNHFDLEKFYTPFWKNQKQ